MADLKTVEAIEAAIRDLTSADLAVLREWFAEFDAQIWDRELESDVLAGRLDALADEALREVRAGRATDL
jgi:hypothetical protein